jgi:2-polyprenyl-3-methyl-5-hydroxy-6-metoxy-1,4-benzoquinol methylase
MTEVKKELYEDIYQALKFSFGKNWRDYLETLTKEKIQISKDWLARFTKLESFEGKTFIDIGSGSGLHSLAAYMLGAKVISSDIDDNSINCVNYLRKMFDADPKRWTIIKGSALDRNFLRRLGKADIVYSWGVLHHTGDMRAALDNVASLVKKDGLLYIAIYNRYDGLLSSDFWLRVKRFYSKTNRLFQWIMVGLYYVMAVLVYVLRLQNPYKTIRNYKSSRGMNFHHDVLDWLGGYPFEYAYRRDIIDFYRKKSFRLANILENNRTGCNEFLFRKT